MIRVRLRGKNGRFVSTARRRGKLRIELYETTTGKTVAQETTARTGKIAQRIETLREKVEEKKNWRVIFEFSVSPPTVERRVKFYSAMSREQVEEEAEGYGRQLPASPIIEIQEVSADASTLSPIHPLSHPKRDSTQ